MKKSVISIIILCLLFTSLSATAKTTDKNSTKSKTEATHGTNGKVTAKSIGAGALSLLIWPGIGQAVNGQKYDKNVTHALLGLTGVFRFWSCYDAIVDRNGGVWKNRI